MQVLLTVLLKKLLRMCHLDFRSHLTQFYCFGDATLRLGSGLMTVSSGSPVGSPQIKLFRSDSYGPKDMLLHWCKFRTKAYKVGEQRCRIC